MPRDYAIVSPQFWTGATGRRLRSLGVEAQLVALYVVTSPHANMIGLYYLPLPTLSHEVGLPLEGARKALRSLAEVGFAFYDDDAEEVWVPEMARYQVAEQLAPKDNRCKGVASEAAKYRKSPFYRDFLSRYAEAFHLGAMPLALAPEPPLARPSEAPSKDHRSQDQDQDQDHAAAARARPREVESLASPERVCDKVSGPGAGGQAQPPPLPVSAPGPASPDSPSPRRLTVLDLAELGPLGAEYRAAVEADLGHGLALASAGEELQVREELEALLERAGGVERAVTWTVATVLSRRGRPGAEPGSVAWCVKLLRSLPPPPASSGPPDPGCEEWARMLVTLRGRLRSDLVQHWFAPLRGRMDEGELVLDAPDRFHRDFVEDQYREFLAGVAREVLGGAVVVRIDGQREEPRQAAGGAT